MVNVTFRLDPQGVRAIMAPGGIVGRFTRDYADRVADQAKRNAPSATGTLRDSIVVKQARGIGGRFVSGWTVTAEADYALYAHEGRGPGKMPPDAPIREWLRAVGGPGAEERSFIVRRAIGRRGTTGVPFLADAIDQVRP